MKKDKITLFFIPVHITSILLPMDQVVISTYRSCYLRNVFCKAIAALQNTPSARGSDPSDRSGQSKLRTFWKGLPSLDAIMNICDSWEEAKISTLTEADSNLHE